MMANYYSDDDEMDCPDEIESCNVIHMEMDLSPGDYTLLQPFIICMKSTISFTQKMVQTVSEWDW